MAGPWERYQAESGPWARYAAPEAATVSTGEDIAKSAVSGLAKGAMSTGGAIGDFRDLGTSLVAKGAGYLGASPETAKTISDVVGMAQRLNPITMFAPTTKQVTEALKPITGELYKPQTTAGEFANTVSEFIPGALLGPGSMGRKVLTGAAAGAGSEAGGQAAKGTAAEPYARVVGALAGGIAPTAVSRMVTPLPAPQSRQAALEVLAEEGVPLTAGQRSGSKALQYLESTMGDLPGTGGRAGQIQREQSQAFTRAALRRIGEDADLATPEVMAGARTRIGNAFDDIAGRANATMDAQFARDIGETVREYVRVSNPGQRPRLPDDIANALTDFAQNQGGVIAGDQLQSLRSMLTRYKTSDPELTQFLGSVRRAVDNLVERTAAPGIAEEWRAARSQYRNMRALEKALGGAGENAAQGMLSPQMLRSAIAAGNQKGAYVRGQGDFADLARAGNAAMPQLPQSGTAPRQYSQAMLSALSGVGTGAATGDPYMALLGLAGPAVLGRALMSRPTQAYLGNQIMPQWAGRAPEMTGRDRLLLMLMQSRPALPINQ
jgi:hypothetical protein